MADPAVVSEVIATVSHGDVTKAIVSMAGTALIIMWRVSRMVTRIQDEIRRVGTANSAEVGKVVAVNSAEHAGILTEVGAIGARVTRVETRVDDHVNDHVRWAAK